MWKAVEHAVHTPQVQVPMSSRVEKRLHLTQAASLFSIHIAERGAVCCLVKLTWQKFHVLGLPWWHSGWESACQCRGHGFEPWSGKIPHAAEHLGPWATITEPVRLEPVLRNKRGRGSERPAHRDEEWPPLAATRESSRTETKTLHRQK